MFYRRGSPGVLVHCKRKNVLTSKKNRFSHKFKRETELTYLSHPDRKVRSTNASSWTSLRDILRLPKLPAISCLNSLGNCVPFQFRRFSIHDKYQPYSKTCQVKQSKEKISQMRFIYVVFQTFGALSLANPSAQVHTESLVAKRREVFLPLYWF